MVAQRTATMATLVPLGNLGLVTAAVAVNRTAQPEGMVAPHLAVEVVAEAHTGQAEPGKQAEMAAEARCEYGPGSSEQCRTQRPGCAEA